MTFHVNDWLVHVDSLVTLFVGSQRCVKPGFVARIIWVKWAGCVLDGCVLLCFVMLVFGVFVCLACSFFQFL